MLQFLVFADYSKPFRLETDASGVGLGAVLSQLGEDGLWHPVAYGSRMLSDSEKKYHSSKLEFLALKWAITEHFREYLEHCPSFEVRTDNNPLTYIMTTPNLDACGQRWVEKLASFNFSLSYLKGAQNGAADCLSRLPIPSSDDSGYHSGPAIQLRCCPSSLVGDTRVYWNEEAVVRLLDATVVGDANPVYRGECEQISLVQEEDKLFQERLAAVNSRAARVADFYTTDWAQLQRQDPILDAVMNYVEAKYSEWRVQKGRGRKRKRNERKQSTTIANHSEVLMKDFLQQYAFTNEGKACLRMRQNFCLIGGKLYVTVDVDGNTPVKVFVVPKAQRHDAINGCHRDAGHQGRDRTISLLAERFWWPGMRDQCKLALAGCERCKRYEGRTVSAPLQPIVATSPLDLVHLDYTTCEITANPNVVASTSSILCITDHFHEVCHGNCYTKSNSYDHS